MLTLFLAYNRDITHSSSSEEESKEATAIVEILTPRVKALFGEVKGEERRKIISENTEAACYGGRMLSSQFYIGAEYPKFFGRMECIMGNEGAALKVASENFSGAPKNNQWNLIHTLMALGPLFREMMVNQRFLIKEE